jgi:hypothetical protein
LTKCYSRAAFVATVHDIWSISAIPKGQKQEYGRWLQEKKPDGTHKMPRV